MKIETKLSLNNMKKNIKRTMFTTLSIALCSFLIFTTILIISSIRNGITEKSNIQYNDYHFIIKNLSADDFNKIKNKNYIDKIYIQENDKAPLKQVDSSYTPSNDINVYLKYTNIEDSYKDSTDIVQTLGFSLFVTNEKCEFNENLLMVYGLVGADLDDSQGPLIYKSILNFSYVINIMIVDFMRSYPNEKEITGPKFIAHSVAMKPNSKDKDVLQSKAYILNWLNTSSRYNSIRTQTTRNNYYKAILGYIAFTINKVNKGA